MREVLFRGKRVDNGEWVYGSYYKHIARQICPIGDKLEECDIIHLMIQSGFADWNMSRPLQATEVIPETVGQFIGREDMNIYMIFKDDLLSTKERDVLFQVVWDNESCGFKFKSIETGTLFEIDSSVEKLEVIGNIHEKGK